MRVKLRLDLENDVRMRMRLESLEDDEQCDGTTGDFNDVLLDEDSDD